MLTLILLTLQSLLINEVMQSNVDVVMDNLNEFPDSWVELYNASSDTLELSDYTISLGAVTEGWVLPTSTVLPKHYVLIYCDKEAVRLHTDFRLPSDEKGILYLYCNKVLTDSLSFPAQPAPNIAYGRLASDKTQCGWMYQPTPGKMNSALALGCLGEPIFSQRGYVMQPYGRDSAVLELSLPAGAPVGTQIRYTLDGSEPTSTSTPYTTPFKIKETTIVRAKLFCPGYVSAYSHVESFIQPGRNLDLPVICITTDDNYLYDNKIGIYVDGTYNQNKKNYFYDWRRPVNFEYFEQVGKSSALNQLGEMRIQGGAMRANPIRSLAVYANKRFGEKRFKYEFFPDQRPGSKQFKSLILRCAGNDFRGLYMRDAVIQRSMSRYVDMDWQAWQPAIIFFNGRYVGMQNIRERSNEDNIWSNYDKLEDLDMIENWSNLKTGTWDEWLKFKAFYNQHGHTWDEYQQWLDCDEFLNVMIMDLFFDNQDFPGNNIVWWRPRNSKDGVPMRWRIVAKDTDFGLGLDHPSPDHNIIYWLYNPTSDPYNQWGNTSDATRLFRRAMEDSTFCRHFMERTAIYAGDFMNLDRIWPETWEPMYEMIRNEWPKHSYSYKPRSTYDQDLAKAKQWLFQRPYYFLKQIAEHYKYGAPVPMTISLTDSVGASIRFCDITLSRPIWDGYFYIGAPFSLEAPVSGWQVVITTATGRTEQTISGSTCTLTIPSNSQKVSIVGLTATGLEDIYNAQCTMHNAKFIQSGQLYILRDGQLYNAQGIRR